MNKMRAWANWQYFASRIPGAHAGINHSMYNIILTRTRKYAGLDVIVETVFADLVGLGRKTTYAKTKTGVVSHEEAKLSSIHMQEFHCSCVLSSWR